MEGTRKIIQIKSEARALASDEQRVARIQDRQRRREARIAEAKKELVVSLAQEVGLLSLPATAIGALIAGLRGQCAAQLAGFGLVAGDDGRGRGGIEADTAPAGAIAEGR